MATKLRLFLGLACCVCLWRGNAFAQAPTVLTAPPATAAGSYNNIVLQQIATMPQLGGYSASHQATQQLASALFFTSPTVLSVEAARAQPSYCSGATYLVFMKTVGELSRRGVVALDAKTDSALLIHGQRDGEGVWGRWNANGPGTARLFYEMRLGSNFESFEQAAPGDFMKIFWSPAVGRREHGHSVVFPRHRIK